VIIEPDHPDAGLHSATGPGVPHGAQVHMLMPRGRAQLERFFPGVVAQGLAEGAVLCMPERTATYVDEVEQIATPNAEFVASSRPFRESLIRRRVLALPNVELVQGRVIGLGYARDAVESVRCVVDGDQVVAAADFVVDATGRGSRLSDWLEQGSRSTSATSRPASHWWGIFLILLSRLDRVISADCVHVHDLGRSEIEDGETG
jgi:hypothetical protein